MPSFAPLPSVVLFDDGMLIFDIHIMVTWRCSFSLFMSDGTCPFDKILSVW